MKGNPVDRRSPDIPKLARRHRWLTWVILLMILIYILEFIVLASSGVFGASIDVYVVVVGTVVHVLLLVAVVLVLVAEGNPIVNTIIFSVLMLAPCANILMAVLVRGSAGRKLREAGLSVGLMGIKPEDVERILNRELCRRCGYNLRGNVSGICPECGSQIDSSVQPAPPVEEPESELRAWLICGVIALALIFVLFGILSLVSPWLPRMPFF